MTKPIVTFRESVESVRALHSLHFSLCKLLPAIDLSEILRAEVVLMVSAFDCFVHGVVRKGIVDIFYSRRVGSTKSDDFSIPMKMVKQLLIADKDEEREELLDVCVNKILSKNSYQSPSCLESALSLISINKIWKSIKDDMEMPPEDIKNKLGIIVARRNKIAHESDIKNHMDNTKQEINREDVDDIIDFIVKLVESIDNQLRKKSLM